MCRMGLGAIYTKRTFLVSRTPLLACETDRALTPWQLSRLVGAIRAVGPAKRERMRSYLRSVRHLFEYGRRDGSGAEAVLVREMVARTRDSSWQTRGRRHSKQQSPEIDAPWTPLFAAGATASFAGSHTLRSAQTAEPIE